MIYNLYSTLQQTYNYNPYMINNATISGYDVPTYYANNTNG